LKESLFDRIKDRGIEFNSLKYKQEKPKYNKVKEKPKEYVEKDLYTALVFGDCHFPYHDEISLNLMKQVMKDIKNDIDEVIDLGDGIDGGKLSKYINFEDVILDLHEEMELYKEFLDELKLIVPESRFVCCEDNHYHIRMEKFIRENPAMKNMVKKFDFPYDKVVRHGRPYFPFNQKKVAMIHGIYYNEHYAKKYTVSYPHDMIVGHTHSRQHYSGVNQFECYGIGCMCKLDMAYLQGERNKWSNSFCVFTYDKLNDNYNLEYIKIENGSCLFRGKVYKYGE